jgi:hypothetical protein
LKKCRQVCTNSAVGATERAVSCYYNLSLFAEGNKLVLGQVGVAFNLEISKMCEITIYNSGHQMWEDEVNKGVALLGRRENSW